MIRIIISGIFGKMGQIIKEKIKQEDNIEINQPYAASVIRNVEMVFDAALFDHYGWKAKNGVVSEFQFIVLEIYIIF